jgi:hypothetical protein
MLHHRQTIRLQIAPPVWLLASIMSMPCYCCCRFCRFPVMRLAVTASPLKLHLSPYRYQQLMMVLQSIAPAAPAADAGAAAATATAAGTEKPLWLSESEYSGKVRPAA